MEIYKTVFSAANLQICTLKAMGDYFKNNFLALPKILSWIDASEIRVQFPFKTAEKEATIEFMSCIKYSNVKHAQLV